MFSIECFCCPSVASVPARSVTGHSIAVVPTASVLTEVATQGACISDLWTRHLAGRFGQKRKPFTDQRVSFNLGQCCQCTDFNPIIGFINTPKSIEALEIDHCLRTLPSVLKPAKAIHATSEGPSILTVLFKQIECSFNACGLNELEARNHVLHHRACLATECSLEVVYETAVVLNTRLRSYP